MAAFEYDVVSLQQHHEAGDRRCFRWKSRRGGCHDVDYSELEEMLNLRGEQGWQVVAQDSDARFGSVVILMRIKEDAPAKKASKTAATETPISAPPVVVSAPPVDLAPLLAEIQALRAQLASQPVPQVTVQPTPVHVTAPTVNVESVRPQLAEVLTVLRQIEAGQPAAARVVGRLIEDALQAHAAPQPNAEPKFERKRPWFGWSWVIGR